MTDECAMIWRGMNLWKYDLLTYGLVWDTLHHRKGVPLVHVIKVPPKTT